MSDAAEAKESWAIAEAMYLAGKGSHADIARDAGVTVVALRKRIARKGLASLKARLKALETGQANMSLVARSEAVKTLVAAEVHQSAAQLESLPRGKDIDGFEKRAGAVNTLVSTADKVFGWQDSARPQSVFNIALLENTWLIDRAAGVKRNGHEVRQLTPEELQELDRKAAIDVPSTPLPEAGATKG